MTRGLSLDIWAFFTQLDGVLDVCRSFPDLAVVVNHLVAQSVSAPMRTVERRFFRSGRCACVAYPIARTSSSRSVALVCDMPDSASAKRPYLRHRIAWTTTGSVTGMNASIIFGADRCMFESNFPVDRGMFSYQVLWSAFKKLTTSYSKDERDDLFSGTATRTYRLASPAV